MQMLLVNRNLRLSASIFGVTLLSTSLKKLRRGSRKDAATSYPIVRVQLKQDFQIIVR
jgi:hypothetical protein